MTTEQQQKGPFSAGSSGPSQEACPWRDKPDSQSNCIGAHHRELDSQPNYSTWK